VGAGLLAMAVHQAVFLLDDITDIASKLAPTFVFGGFTKIFMPEKFWRTALT
jgi:hypothetical protein